MATIPKRVIERLGKDLRKFQRVLKAAIDRDFNETDTVLFISDME